MSGKNSIFAEKVKKTKNNIKSNCRGRADHPVKNGMRKMKIQEKKLENVIDAIEKEIQKETGKRYTFAVYDVDGDWFGVSFGEPDGGDVELSMYIDDRFGKFETDSLNGIETQTDEEAYYLFVEKINGNFKRIVK